MQKKSSSKKSASKAGKGLVKVRASTVHGRGVYATKRIRKGARIIEYTGGHIPWIIAQDLPAHRPDDPYHTFYFSIDNGDVIDGGTGGNASRWINHSCEPNCETEEEDDRIFIYALRTVQPGEELFYDYRIEPAERRTKKLEKEFTCLCGSAKCRGTMLEPVKKKPLKA